MSTAQGDVLARMASTTTRLTELVESVLAYARVESGHWNPQPEAFDAAELVRDVVDELRPEIRDKPLTLNMHPCAEKRLDMVSDPRLVRLVLGNLVANAIKFSDHGRVDVSVARSGNRFRFVVQDTGPGIPREQRGRIFEPFEQLAQVESKHVQGFGLGLALAKEMVGVLKGQIDLRSVVGAGSTFVVSLPATTEAS
jgi:signal transduction histidine kinase